MAINKVSYFGETLIDLSNDTLKSANQLKQGVIGHLADGTIVTGTAEEGGGESTPVEVYEDADGNIVVSGSVGIISLGDYDTSAMDSATNSLIDIIGEESQSTSLARVQTSVQSLNNLLTYSNNKTNAADTNIGDAIKTLSDGYGSALPQNILVGEFVPDSFTATYTLPVSCAGTMVGYILISPDMEYTTHDDTTSAYLFSAVGKTYINRTTWQAPMTGVKSTGENSYWSNSKCISQSGTTLNVNIGSSTGYVLAKGKRYIFVIIYEE